MVRSLLGLGLVAASVAACAACSGDPDGVPGSTATTGTGGTGATTSTSTAPTTSSTASTTTSGGGGDGREWEPLAWEGLPCDLLVAGPTEAPTLSWQPCAIPGCQFIDPAPFHPGSAAVAAPVVAEGVVTALVRRYEAVTDAVVWDPATGNERFALRGHPDCVLGKILPFVHDGKEKAWFDVTGNNGTLLTSVYYEILFDDLSAVKLNISGGWLTQRSAGNAELLALEAPLGPNVGIWSRETGSFTSLLNQVSFMPRMGPGGVLFQGPNAQNELDGLWWKDGALTTAIVSAPGVHVENPWIVGDQIIWTEGTLGGPGVVKRATFDPASLPVTPEVITAVEKTVRGGASERFYVLLDQSTPEKLHIVNLETDALTVMTLPDEMFWPSSIEHVGVDPFGSKEVAWVRENKTIYRIELE